MLVLCVRLWAHITLLLFMFVEGEKKRYAEPNSRRE